MQGDNAQKDLMDFLARHVDRVESIRNHILKEYYEESSDERDSFKGMVDGYSGYIRTLIADETRFPGEDKWPIVLIGSIVEVHDLGYDEVDRIKIVPPFYGGPRNGLDCASCLSPVGKALLLKGIGHEVAVSTPLGSTNLVIKSIGMPSE